MGVLYKLGGAGIAVLIIIGCAYYIGYSHGTATTKAEFLVDDNKEKDDLAHYKDVQQSELKQTQGDLNALTSDYIDSVDVRNVDVVRDETRNDNGAGSSETTISNAITPIDKGTYWKLSTADRDRLIQIGKDADATYKQLRYCQNTLQVIKKHYETN